MPHAYFTPELFKFLRELDRHNNREWFQRNKSRYDQFVRDPFLKFIEDFRPQLNSISPHFIADPRPVGGSLLRIYRDMRFRKDQAPYKTMVAARFPHRAFKERTAPGLYMHLDPQRSFFAGGLWRPDGDTRALVREAIINQQAKWKRAAKSKAFESIWDLSTESFKKLPSGCDPNHPFADDLMRKDFAAGLTLTQAEVCDPGFLDQITNSTRAAAPFLEFLTRAAGLPWTADDRIAPREILRVE